MGCDNIFLGLGSNLGHRFENLASAVSLIGRLPRTTILNRSSVYETEPVGYRDQANFLNQVVRVETGLLPNELLAECLAIEKRFGRERRIKWGPRTLDIDLLLWGEVVVQSSNLILPHPRFAMRRFVLEPLCEIAPFFRTPLNQQKVQALLESCPDTAAVALYLPETDRVFT